MIAVVRAADWRTDGGAGEALIRTVCGASLMNPHNRFLTALFIKELWTECPHRETAKKIIISILESVGRERSGKLIAAFIYRYPGLRRAATDRKSWVLDGAGGNQGHQMARRIAYKFDPFSDDAGRALKRFLRSWRSRDGEFKPQRRRG